MPVAARIAWFGKDHPYWSIITEIEQLADKAIVMKAVIKDMTGTAIATARKKETEIGFPDYLEKPRQVQSGGHWQCADMARCKLPILTSKTGLLTLQ